jgi:hypothetical protein
MEVRPGRLERQMKKTASSRDKFHEEILKNLKVEPISKFIQNYRANWKDHMKEWILAESQTTF